MKSHFVSWKLLTVCLWAFLTLTARADYQPTYSTAGFYELPNSGRTVYSMNPGWRFHKGAAEGAEQTDYNDREWNVVSLPDGIEYLPAEASGCINYQGEVWYRKHFTPETSWKGKKLFLHFEAIMGKSKVWVNGKLLKEHFGGFLPVIVDVTSALKYGEDNIIAVWADNSDDPSYPPGKTQDMLDFAYFGGIYRDCWMKMKQQQEDFSFLTTRYLTSLQKSEWMHTSVTNPESPSTENWSMNYGTGKENRYLRRKKACPSAKERHVSFLSRLR